ncbi:glycoside hydrolase family 30 protein [Fulvivirga lutea]|uniref:Glycoside hydrolase family 30 protein n=1 Tax=Fulvivirga lutea TaxID=2810512 RepID=A0A974WFB3_9BACT|nr:glycoside hydrolase family 30 protein [Fulvivirga lutea]QSE96428.1 glycoside hydrolase family 30 protein [Fulvivirga lutea]
MRYEIHNILIICFLTTFISCNNDEKEPMNIDVFETSASGNKLTLLSEFEKAESTVEIVLNPEAQFQKITGFGGSFTEATAYLLNKLSEEKRNEVLEAYFGESGAKYSLTRTHINSCDFSLSNYSYAPIADDMELDSFSIAQDKDDIIPIIKAAQKKSKEGFKIISSPWTAPPWMKDNNSWVGGKLLPKYNDTWALFFSKYISAYANEGINIWGITVENEPLGNGNNWESMHFTPHEMTDFVQNHLGPTLEQNSQSNIKILGYDQNREHLKEWVDAMYSDSIKSNYFDGTAIHWYASTFEVFPDELQYAHQKAPNKHLIQTEACVDAEVPKWKDDAWYWSKEATDWGWDWAPESEKKMHPKYVPVYRYARDIIGCLNNWVDGWVDWNMVLNKQGGPNWFKNWCVAPVLADPENDEVYYTPLYYTMSHFSRFIRPDAVRIGLNLSTDELLATAVHNPDGTIALVVLNQENQPRNMKIKLKGLERDLTISAKALQTIIISPKIE